MDLGIEIINKLEQEGYKAFIIGGAPRDLYLGIVTDDIDICTNAPLYIIENLFKVTKTNFASSVIEYENKRFEITHFRKDVEYKNHRFPTKIELVDDLQTDLLRRDFIINTLCIDSEGNYVDLLNAKIDLNNKIIRSVGKADAKIKEDALRILRAIRFATILNFDIEEELNEAIINNVELVNVLSRKRKYEELEKMINSNNYKLGVKFINKYGLDKIFDIVINANMSQTELLNVIAQI